MLFKNYSLSSSLYHPKIIGDILKNVRKTSLSVLRILYINGHENEAKNETYITKIETDLGLRMDTNILNVKCVSV